MEILSVEFLTALLAIVVIDLVLAGDNAIVIALAARRLPPALQRRAILAGTVGAVVVRTTMTLIVVWLLKIPGLLLAGGALLIFIAYRLLRPEPENDAGHEGDSAVDFWGAMRTIVVADAVMGLDNVLAVAGAAHGSFLLVVLGLLISVPIVVWGSTFVLRIIERHPSVVYLGSGVLAATAVKMITSEPLLQDSIRAYSLTIPMLYIVTIFGVLWFGFVSNHYRLESRISARVAKLAHTRDALSATAALQPGEQVMMKVLVPVDGSSSSLYGARHAIKECLGNPGTEIHLLSVQPRFSRHISQFLAKGDIEAFYREEGEKKLRTARELFERQNIPYVPHVEIGAKAEVIAATASRLKCHHIVMGTARKNSVTRMFEASVTNRVIELTTVPVEVIAGNASSNLERYGIPAGVGAAIAMLVAAMAD